MKFSLQTWTKQHPTITNGLLVLLSTLFTFFSLEYLFSLYLWMYQPQLFTELSAAFNTVKTDNTSMRFQPHPYLSYARTDTQMDDKGIQIGENYYAIQKPKDVIRIACIGGSTTMNQHPLHLKRFLEAQFDSPKYEVMDFGCDGWTSQESLINYMIRIQLFSPDYLIIHHGVNDGPPRIWGDWRPDYTNFRTSWYDQSGVLLRYLSKHSFLIYSILYFKGIMIYDIQNYVIQWMPQEKQKTEVTQQSMLPFQRNIDTLFQLAQSNGTKVILAPVNYNTETITALDKIMIDEHRQFLLKYAQEHNIPSWDNRWILEKHPDWFLDSVHLKDQGILHNTRMFTAIIRDQERGYSEIVDQDGNNSHHHIHLYNEDWIPQRRIRLHWAMNIPNSKEYHIYVKEKGNNENFFLAKTRRNDIHTLEWYNGNELLNGEFLNGPDLIKEYQFKIFAVTENKPYPVVGDKIEKGLFEIEDWIVFQANDNAN